MDESRQQSAVQTAMAPFPSIVPGSDRPLPGWDWRTWLVLVPLVLIVNYAFLPALDNGFVTGWDDDRNFVENPHFRGLGPAQVKWAFTTTLVGVYQPLAWLLFEAEYLFCQLDPRGYHVTSLVLQVVNAVVLYALTLSLLERCRAGACLESPWICSVSAGFATALFAVHPLRAESVAWASAQPYLPSTLFAMLSVLAYLHAFRTSSSPRWGWLLGSFFLFVVALLFKAVAVSLPLVLLILDVYPLRRFGSETEGWFGSAARRALLEKIPFLSVSIGFAALTVGVREQSPFRVDRYDALEGMALACYSIWFYIQKTVLPLDLVFVHPLLAKVNWMAPPYRLSILATLAFSAGLFLLRGRWPGLLAAWLSYLVILAPSSGIIPHNTVVSVADRYSYMSTLSIATLASACFCGLWKASSQWRDIAAIGTVAIGFGVLLCLTSLTRNQCRTWCDMESLWTHALTHETHSSEAPRVLGYINNNLGTVVYAKGKHEQALAHYVEAVRLFPDYADAHNNLGSILYLSGKYEEAEAEFTEALRIEPAHEKAHNNLATALEKKGHLQEAEAHYAEAIRLRPGNGQTLYHLGLVLARLGNYEAAQSRFAEVIRLLPGEPAAYNASSLLMAACPEARFRDGKKAVELAMRACELTKWKNPTIIDTLAAAQAEAGDFDAAVKSQERAIELLTVERQKCEYRSRLVLYRGKRPYRQRALQHASNEAPP